MTGKDWQETRPPSEGPSRSGRSAVPQISIVLPCFNEEANIGPVYRDLVRACQGLDYEILFVDDGSSDGTAGEVENIRARDPGVRLLRFVRNAGHQNALRAGYREARGDYVLTMDADLQHPAESVPMMLAKVQEGFDVVQMVRSGSQHGLWKNLLSRGFYKIFNALSDVPIIEQGSDFRLVSRYVCDVLNALPERNLIVRAILPYLGFRTASLPFALADRVHGHAAYSFRKSLDLGSHTLFNFSAFPLKLAMRLGLLISTLSFAYGVYNVAAKFFTEGNVPGYTDLIASTLFLGGLILLYLGILGRYILVILDHLKQRPEYLLAHPPRPGPESRDPGKGVPEAGGHEPERRPKGRRTGLSS